MADYNTTTATGECIFCEIARGKIKPLGKGLIHEDEDHIAWLSPYPNTEGFTIVAPKEHFGSDVMAMPEEKLQALFAFTKKVIQILIDFFPDVGRVGVLMEGTGIDHAHIKLSPMHDTEYLKQGQWRQIHSNYDRYFKTYEGYISSHDGPEADFDSLKKLAEKIRRSAE